MVDSSSRDKAPKNAKIIVESNCVSQKEVAVLTSSPLEHAVFGTRIKQMIEVGQAYWNGCWNGCWVGRRTSLT